MKSTAAIKAFFVKESVFVAAVLFLYLLISGFTIFNHEMWRDELQAWMLVKASPTFSSLLQNIRYEGHPILWFALLWVLKFISTQPQAIQVLHFTIAASSAFIWLRFAPSGKLWRALFIFGYYPVYEYAVISRNYAIGVLLLFIFCAVYQRQHRNYILLALLLFLIMQANFFALLIALAIGFGLCIDVILSRKNHIYNWSKMLLAVIIFLAGLALSIYTIFPPHDHFFGGTWREEFSLRSIAGVFTIIWRSMAPVPLPEIHFWNTNIIGNVWMQLILSCILILLSIFIFHRKKWILAIFLSGSFAILLFFYMRMFGSLRHQGHIYILFIVCLWLINNYKSINNKSGQNIIAYIQGWKNTSITILLVLNLLAGAIAVFTDYHFTFSAAKNTARYLKYSKLDDMPIVADADMVVSSVAGYLDTPVYYPLTDTLGTYIIWNKTRDKILDENTLIRRADSVSKKQIQDVALVLSYPLKKDYSNIIALKAYSFSIEASEVFYIYRLKYKLEN